MLILGIDTSNYTTSCALFDSEKRTVAQRKRLLPVKAGEKGLRQSDAVFHHTVQLPQLMEELFDGAGDIAAVGVSEKPRDAEGSYMPCFLVGVNSARCVGAAAGKPVHTFFRIRRVTSWRLSGRRARSSLSTVNSLRSTSQAALPRCCSSRPMSRGALPSG